MVEGDRMNVVMLDEDNIEMYTEYLTPDVAENIGRTFYRGIVITDGDAPAAGMVWEIRNMMKDDDTVSNILYLKIEQDLAEGILFDEYRNSIVRDGVVRSFFSLPAKTSGREKEALTSAGFDVKFMEGDIIKAALSEVVELSLVKKITPSDNIRSLKTITQRGFSVGIRQFAAKGLCGHCEDIMYLSRSFFENDISCYSEVDGQMNGILLIHKNPSGALVVMVMAAIGNDYGKILPQLISYAVSRAGDLYSHDTEVVIDRHNYASLALSEKLFPRGFGIPVYVGSREE